ncbi:MAG: hypothetical protein AAGI71_04605 [Bacteroidota bacterium]
MSSADRIARFTAFATLGAMNTTQELARELLSSVDGADPEVVAEESLCLVATATARAAEVGLQDAPSVGQAAAEALLALPFTYRDYLVGGAMIASQNAAYMDANEEVYQRLQRKQAFYGAHLPSGRFPGPRALTDKMELWMGRVSPPGLPVMPAERLADLGLVDTVVTHLKLVLAFGRRGGTDGR